MDDKNGTGKEILTQLFFIACGLMFAGAVCIWIFTKVADFILNAWR